MRKTNIDQAKTIANAAFGSMVKTKRSYIENAVTNGRPSAAIWFDSDVDLPNEVNMYGSFIFRPLNDGVNVANTYTIDKSQFALFAIAPKFIIASPDPALPGQTRRNIWLGDPVSATHFARADNLDRASYDSASASYGVRPCFAIG